MLRVVELYHKNLELFEGTFINSLSFIVNEEYPKVYKRHIVEKVVFIIISFVVGLFSLVLLIENLSLGIYVALFIFFLIFIILTTSSFAEKFILYEDRFVLKELFFKDEVFFNNIKGYIKRNMEHTHKGFKVKDEIYFIFTKDNPDKKIKIPNSLVGNHEIFYFIEDNFKNLDEIKNK